MDKQTDKQTDRHPNSFIYIDLHKNDISHLINNAKILTFADDTKIISKISTVEDTVNLQQNLNSIITICL